MDRLMLTVTPEDGIDKVFAGTYWLWKDRCGMTDLPIWYVSSVGYYQDIVGGILFPETGGDGERFREVITEQQDWSDGVPCIVDGPVFIGTWILEDRQPTPAEIANLVNFGAC